MSSANPSGNRKAALQKANLVSFIVDLFLSAIKIVVGFLYHSQALVVDGIHSFSDLVTDLFVIWITRLSHQDPDEEHPYGHARFETAGTVIFGLILLAVAAVFMWKGMHEIWSHSDFLMPGWPALGIAVVAVFIKEALYQYTLKMAFMYNSPLLRANAWHHRSDVLSTIVVIVGISGALSGAPWLDPLAAIVVAMMIAWVGVALIKKSIIELVDTSPLSEQLPKLKQQISRIKGVRGVHSLRSRRMGPNILLDVHIQVPSTISVSEGHQIGDTVSQTLIENHDEISEVFVHIDPEDDLESEQAQSLPQRREVMQALEEIPTAALFIEQIKDVQLHFLSGKVHLNILLPLASIESLPLNGRQLSEQVKKEAAHLTWLGNIQIFFWD
ncbi:MAG: cation-efflux pump [Gammaproteobacteria bacterium CG22_combo_CG10-13_8_21_14_all_40_8]|nr:MAG: cation-efflux pump [Gammaproteobacteria bacterium CG22_combo_CG10-13_8_21_14_all_40_8]